MNHIISECSKLALKEFKTRHDWVGKVIRRELCKIFKFDHRNKWCMHNLESVLETHKVLCDYEIQMNHQISTGRPDLMIVHKKNVDFAVPANHRVKLKESEKKNKYLDLARELKKLWNIKVTIIPIVIDVISTVTKGLVKGLEELKIRERVRPSKLQY